MATEGSQSGQGNGGAGGGAGDGGAGNGAGGSGDGNGSGAGSQGAGAGSQGGNNGAADFNPENLSQEQINQILEKNPHIWKSERIAGLREKAGKYDQAQTEAEKAEQKRLADEGKFKELSEKQAAENGSLKEQIQTMGINQQLTNKLAPMGVVDLEAALALVNRTGIKVDENGTVTGVDEAIEALKTGKAYLFNNNGNGNNASVGSATNTNNGGGTGGVAKFKRSQLQDPAFYKANEQAILAAYKAGQIEDDIGQR